MPITQNVLWIFSFVSQCKHSTLLSEVKLLWKFRRCFDSVQTVVPDLKKFGNESVPYCNWVSMSDIDNAWPSQECQIDTRSIERLDLVEDLELISSFVES